MNTLHDIWTAEHDSDFAAGVQLLASYPGKNPLTRLIWSRLQTLAATGLYVDQYSLGKLAYALEQCPVIHVAAPPDPPQGQTATLPPAADEAQTKSSEAWQFLVEVMKQVPAERRNIPLHLAPTGDELPSTEETSNPEVPAAEAEITPSADADQGDESLYVAPAALTSEAAKALHKEHAHIHALMTVAPDDDTRAGYARDIMERIIPALDAEYDRLRAAQQTQKAPDSEANAPAADKKTGKKK